MIEQTTNLEWISWGILEGLKPLKVICGVHLSVGKACTLSCTWKFLFLHTGMQTVDS